MDVLVLSVHHTGTWTTIQVLKGMGFDGFIQLENYDRHDSFAMRHQTHRRGSIMERIGDNTIFHTHVTDVESSQSFERREFASEFLPTVIPLRDPLLSIITSHKRVAGRGDWHILHEWTRLATYPFRKAPFYFRMDAPDWDGLEKFLGLVVYERKLGKLNSAKPSILDEAYREGNIAMLHDKLGDDWNFLCACESTLRPFLEDRGYRDLLWWD